MPIRTHTFAFTRPPVSVAILFKGTVETLKRISHPFKEPTVFQPDKEICANINDSATLQCCIFGTIEVFFWYKQPTQKQPRIMSRVQKSEVIFYNEFQNDRFQAKSSLNCSNMTISNIIQSDEAMYYCSITTPYDVFGGGTYITIKDEHLTNTSETSTPALWDNSVVCEPTLHGNCTNMNEQVKNMLILGTALSSCALLILCLTYFILRKSKCVKTMHDLMHTLECALDILSLVNERQHPWEKSLPASFLCFAKNCSKTSTAEVTPQCTNPVGTRNRSGDH
ncbi:uncharacterized protein LOC128531785 [Clarias gariepinus]|uniref:uncharacterized protein LOC128531785 n=1 Tax=Clarias gariepinus TaxID=13013 RepID=UPI00234D2E78|nr:uncharacterized protein LOC128531785 [Clarias gariepinus]